MMGAPYDAGSNDAAMADDRVLALIDQLRSPDPATCRLAAEELGKLGDRRALMPLVTLSINDDSAVADAAVTAVGLLGGIEALATLQSLIPDEGPTKHRPVPSRRRRAEPAEAANERFAALSLLIADPVPDVRAAALAAVGSLEDPRGMGLAVAGLHDVDPTVREAAARALGDLGTAIAVEALLTAIDDPDAAVRRAAVDALGNAGDLRAVEALRELAEGSETADPETDAAVREAARRAFQRLADEHPGEVAPLDAG